MTREEIARQVGISRQALWRLDNMQSTHWCVAMMVTLEDMVPVKQQRAVMVARDIYRGNRQ